MTALPLQTPRRWEWLALIAIVFVAIIFRFEQFDQVPPGLHYDEAIDAHIAQEIRSGQWSIYYEEGWGREPLYHTLVAFTLNFVNDPTAALRLTSSLLGLIQLVAAYFLFKKMFDVPTALIGAAWIAVMFWTVSTSRAGLRNITLTAFATLTALVFWHIWSKWRDGEIARQRDTEKVSSLILHPSSLILPGVLLGLTLYTYQPSRVIPLIFVVFFVYLFFRERVSVRTHWRSIAIFFGIALIIAVPLIVFLVQHPAAETGRAFQTEPIRALLRGDPTQVVETSIATLKMFTFDGGGDPQPLYNLSGRPLFIGLGSILFYIGLIVCVIRSKQPAYAFILIWLIVTLLPNMVTAPAPFFYRAIAAQTPTLVLPAIATVAIGGFIHRRGAEAQSSPKKFFSASSRLGGLILALIAIASLGQTAITTQHDYFEVWGNDGDVRFQYSAAHTEIAHVLDVANDSSPAIISGYFSEDADPYIFDQTLHRRDLDIRWFDARESIVAIAGAATERIALPSFTPLDGDLKSCFLDNAQPITATKDFKIYPLDVNALRTSIERWASTVETLEHTATSVPISFDGNIELIGYDRAITASVGSTLPVFTAWRVTSEWQPLSTAIYIHILNPDGTLAAQDDRLGYPRHNWRSGDEFVQVHYLPIGNLSPGTYSIELGIYTRETNVRWAARDRSGRSIGDHILIGSIEIVP
jgi:4-amino-4-deoxy-L-arabinose transferase-like glycosyltransferase